jgi:Stage II sporulation protein E (SpoIIE)
VSIEGRLRAALTRSGAYDVFESSGGWAVVVAVTGLARHTLRAGAMHEDRPSRVLADLNAALLREPSPQQLCTVVYARLDPIGEGFRVTCAAGGHPLPLLLRRDGTVEPVGTHGLVLDAQDDPPLADTSRCGPATVSCSTPTASPTPTPPASRSRPPDGWRRPCSTVAAPSHATTSPWSSCGSPLSPKPGDARRRRARWTRAMTRERWMALGFATGSLCFLVGPFPGYAQLVGAAADAATFFAGSVLFTLGGLLQSRLAAPGRRSRGPGRAAWRAAIVQSAGTLFFNVTTYRALDTALSDPDYDRLVWRPDAFGSICFLVSGVIAYRAAARRGWEPTVNLLGCVLFAIAAVAGYVVPARGSVLDLAAANWSTALGAACFLACGLGTLRTGRTMKRPRLHRLERAVERDVERIA